MYYDDEARRFNFLSGLVFGAMLGTGLALLLVPEKGTRRRSRRRADWQDHAAAGLGRVREGVLVPVRDAVAAARRRLGR